MRLTGPEVTAGSCVSVHLDLSEGLAGCPLLDHLQSCAEAFFLGLRVKCLPTVAAASIHCSSRPSQDADGFQLHTGGLEGCGGLPGVPLCSNRVIWKEGALEREGMFFDVLCMCVCVHAGVCVCLIHVCVSQRTILDIIA